MSTRHQSCYALGLLHQTALKTSVFHAVVAPYWGMTTQLMDICQTGYESTYIESTLVTLFRHAIT